VLPLSNVFSAAQQYFLGLIKAPKSNMEQMADTVMNSNNQSLHHFLANSKWSYRDVMDHVAQDVSTVFEGKPGTCLLVDESGFAKKGDHSAGVSRQWNGRLGKVDNSQVGVFTALSRGRDTALIDGELFLPESWCMDNKKCAKAKIPEDKRRFRTKLDIALQQIKRARDRGIAFEWVGADSLYGRSLSFANTLNEWGMTFVLDVPASYTIYEHDPCPSLAAPSERGRRRHKDKYVTQELPVDVRQWLGQQDDSDWQNKKIRKGTKGSICARVLCRQVWIWDGKSPQANRWRLIVRKNLDGSELRFSISNAPSNVSSKRLAYMQSQRHFVERAFQDAKTELGMAEYQTRAWESWHKHMSLVMMGMLFFLKEKVFMREELPFITISDVVMYFSIAIPDKKSSDEGLYDVLTRRNEARRKAHLNSFGSEPPNNGLYV
jgi:SRSO17 transposase